MIYTTNECWLLLHETTGPRLAHGEVLSQDSRFGQTVIVLDGDEPRTVPSGEVLHTAQAVRERIAQQVTRLAHISAQFDDEQAFAALVEQLDADITGSFI